MQRKRQIAAYLQRPAVAGRRSKRKRGGGADAGRKTTLGGERHIERLYMRRVSARTGRTAWRSIKARVNEAAAVAA